MNNEKVSLQYLETGNPQICEKVLRSLPDWFGIEESTLAYIEKSKKLPMITAFEEDTPLGFLSLKDHSAYTSEVYVMGVIPSHHRSGIGRMLLLEAEKHLARRGFEFIQVKTVSANRECEFYKKTRLFYKSFGFKEVEVFPTLWDESNPCQLLIKSLPNKVSGINHITLSVSDLNKSFCFYRDVLKFVPKFKNEKTAYFSVNSTWIALEEDQGVRKGPLPEYTHIAFNVTNSNFSEVSQCIAKSGAEIFKENKSEGKSIYFLDPDGHKLEIHCGSLDSRLMEYKSNPKDGYQFYE